jgi:hypothetical protein
MMALVSESRFVRSPIDIDRGQGSVGTAGPFLLRALRRRTIARLPFKDDQAHHTCCPAQMGATRRERRERHSWYVLMSMFIRA